jgi:hypothetical protein
LSEYYGFNIFFVSNNCYNRSCNFEINCRSYCDRTFKECRLQTCYVQSPAYPGVYPRNLKCNYWLNTKNQFIKLYIQNEEFNVDGQRCENIITCPMRPITSGRYPLITITFFIFNILSVNVYFYFFVYFIVAYTMQMKYNTLYSKYLIAYK